jgi:type VI secretion system secreted protein Hcp
MPQPFYVKITGASQGSIEGGCDRANHEDTIMCYQGASGITRQYSAGSGLPTNPRQHQPIEFLKDVDKATPKLHLAAVKGETLTSVVMDFYRISKTGEEENYFRVTLGNAIIVSAEILAGDATPDGGATTGDHILERIKMTFNNIKWEWLDGGIEGQDTW